MEQIVRKLEPTGPPPETRGEGTRRELEVHVQAEVIEHHLKRATVSGRGTPFEIYSDEGPGLGGTDMAPPPLSYFSAGIAF